MEKDKNFDLKVMMEFRKELHCKKCDCFPRPDVKLMRCVSCTKLLCSKCCDGGTVCPLCQYKSKSPKIPTLILQSELMKAIPVFKTQSCANVKNGCHDEIPTKLDGLKTHDQSCIYQMVPCPKMNCMKTFIFKDLDEHLKQIHINEVIFIYHVKDNLEYDSYNRGIFGTYHLQAELVNGRNYYQMIDINGCKNGIWFSPMNNWMIGNSSKKGTGRGFATVKKDIPFPDNTISWKWECWVLDQDPTFANEVVGAKVLSFNLTKEWNFEGTKEELLASFCCLNAYNRQFYPQFKEVNGCLIFRTLMLGFQEETIPFQASITFFHENDKPLPTSGGIVYPITKEKSKIFETSTHYHLNQLTEYYDTETKGFKKQSKIIFNMKIISPKLDEIAKDQNVESGIEDSDEEPSRPCPKKKMKKI